VAERFKAPVLKTGRGATLSWVRIPPLPQDALHPPSPRSLVADLPIWTTGREGRLVPSGSGACIHVNKLPELRDAINKMTAAAAELGLLRDV
jgi:hypothetical protein